MCVCVGVMFKAGIFLVGLYVCISRAVSATFVCVVFVVSCFSVWPKGGKEVSSAVPHANAVIHNMETRPNLRRPSCRAPHR